MADFGLLECPAKGKVGSMEGRKYHPNSLKDVKRKLSIMNKKINDLHHQRKFAYKNSVKMKKMVHNQINQIVKCLRARERSLWSDVDEAYISQDSSISDELSKLQLVYARCQTLFNHLQDFKGKTDILMTIYSILSEVSFGEIPDVKQLELISDFEAMKVKAAAYGRLEGDFIKKGDFAFVVEDKTIPTLNASCKQLHNKEEFSDETLPSSNIDAETSKSYLEKCIDKEKDGEDFEIIDLLDSMCCHDYEDCIMVEDGCLKCIQEDENKFSRSTSGNDNKFITKSCNNAEQTYVAHENNMDFNPEEEWKQIFEMNKKISSLSEMTSNLASKKQNQLKMKNILDYPKNRDELYDESFKQNSCVLLNEVDSWLHKLNPKKDILEKEKPCEKSNIEINCTTPAELIQQSFKPYLTGGDSQNWLSYH